jgi:hypothetical protein
LAAAALAAGQQDGGADVPWLFIAGIIIASLILGLVMSRRPAGKPTARQPRPKRRK